MGVKIIVIFCLLRSPHSPPPAAWKPRPPCKDLKRRRIWFPPSFSLTLKMHWPEISFSVEETFSTSLPGVAFLTAWEKWLCSLIYIFNSLWASWTHGSSKQESRLLSVLSSPFFPLSNRTSSSKPRRVVMARGTGMHGQRQHKRCLRSLDPSTWSLSLSQAAASSG